MTMAFRSVYYKELLSQTWDRSRSSVRDSWEDRHKFVLWQAGINLKLRFQLCFPSFLLPSHWLFQRFTKSFSSSVTYITTSLIHRDQWQLQAPSVFFPGYHWESKWQVLTETASSGIMTTVYLPVDIIASTIKTSVYRPLLSLFVGLASYLKLDNWVASVSTIALFNIFFPGNFDSACCARTWLSATSGFCWDLEQISGAAIEASQLRLLRASQSLISYSASHLLFK